MQLPRITKSIFLDQFIFMQLAGVVIGLVLPYFLVLSGLYPEGMTTLNLYIASLLAGQIVGLISFLLISTVIRPHLKLLSKKMQSMALDIQKKDASSNLQNKIDVTSDDEIGVSAKAYNQLVDALIKADKIERVFNEFSVIMSDNLELSRLTNETISLLLRSTNFEASAVLVVQRGSLELVSSQGVLHAESLAEHDVVLKTLNSSVATNISLPKNISLDGVLTEFKPSEVFIEPIEFKGSTLGVFIAATGSHLADGQTKQLIRLFSRSIGLAINNTIIHSKFQHLASIDGLTSMYNRRFGMERLKEDFVRAVREQSNMSVAMLDIDHFKAVNDTYGHLVGDKAIKIVAKIIKDVLRDGDIVIRYGGEEFLMILHGATSVEAFEACERIRHQIMDTVIYENDQQIKLTISIGLASYPEQQATDEVEMVYKADQALYVAKDSGRNRTHIFGEVNE